MARNYVLALCSLMTLFSLVSTESSRPFDSSFDTSSILNRCLRGKHHKAEPTPEEEGLAELCAPWARRSCCTVDTANLIHFGESDLYNFRYDHCGRPLSPECMKKFRQNHCFYECSPNLGPWLAKVNMVTRNETFVDVPLCKTDCDSWFEACKDDLTCTNNWIRHFDWKKLPGSKKKTNVCPTNSTCTKIGQVFQNAQDFCENIWDNNYKYTPDNQPCMRMWFDPLGENPNDRIAKWKVGQGQDSQDADKPANEAASSSAPTGLLSLITFIAVSQVYHEHC